jgi:hypothetical protein
MGTVDQRKQRATLDNSEGRAAELRGLAGFPLLGFWVTRRGGQVGLGWETTRGATGEAGWVAGLLGEKGIPCRLG